MRGGEAEQSAREYEGKSMRGGKDRGAESAREDEGMNGREGEGKRMRGGNAVQRVQGERKGRGGEEGKRRTNK